MHYFTVGHYLQSRCNCFLFPGEVHTVRKGQSLETASLNVPQKHNTILFESAEASTNLARSLHAARLSITRILSFTIAYMGLRAVSNPDTISKDTLKAV